MKVFNFAKKISSGKKVLLFINYLVICCLAISNFGLASVNALSDAQKKVIEVNSLYFDVDDSQNPGAACQTNPDGTTPPPVELVGNDNIEKAYRYFITRGLKPHQSAGVVGNLRAESGVDPTAFNPAG